MMNNLFAIPEGYKKLCLRALSVMLAAALVFAQRTSVLPAFASEERQLEEDETIVQDEVFDNESSDDGQPESGTGEESSEDGSDGFAGISGTAADFGAIEDAFELDGAINMSFSTLYSEQQSGRENAVKIVLGFMGAGGEQDRVIPENTFQIRVMLPADAEVKRFSGKRDQVLDYENHLFGGPEYDGINTPPEGFQYVWLTWIEPFAPGDSVETGFDAVLFPNHITGNGAIVTLEAEAFFNGESLRLADDSLEGTGSQARTFDVAVIADNFQWKTVQTRILDGEIEKLTKNNLNVAADGERLLLSPITLIYSSAAMLGDQFGHVYTAGLTISDTIQVPCIVDPADNTKQIPQILIKLSELEANVLAAGGTLSGVESAVVETETYVTRFTVTLPVLNPAGDPDTGLGPDRELVLGENGVSAPSFVIPASELNRAAITNEQSLELKSLVLGVGADNKPNPDKNALIGGVVPGYETAGSGGQPVALQNFVQTILYVPLDKTADNRAATQNQGILKANNNAAQTEIRSGETVKFKLYDFKNMQDAPMTSFRVTDRGYDLNEMYPTTITTGYYRTKAGSTAAADPFLGGTYNVIVRFVPGTTTLPDDQYVISGTTYLTARTINLDGSSSVLPADASARFIESITFDYGPVTAGFYPYSVPTVSFKALMPQLEPLDGVNVGAKDFYNHADLDYVYMGFAGHATAQAQITYRVPDVYSSFKNKSITNTISPAAGEKVNYRLNIVNDSNSNWHNPIIIDSFDPQYLEALPVTAATGLPVHGLKFYAATQLTGFGIMTDGKADYRVYNVGEEAAFAEYLEENNISNYTATLPVIVIPLLGHIKPGYTAQIDYSMMLLQPFSANPSDERVYNRYDAFAYLGADGAPGPGGPGTGDGGTPAKPQRVYVQYGNHAFLHGGAGILPTITVTKTAVSATHADGSASRVNGLELGDKIIFDVSVTQSTDASNSYPINLKYIVDHLPTDTLDTEYFEFTGDCRAWMQISKAGSSTALAFNGNKADINAAPGSATYLPVRVTVDPDNPNYLQFHMAEAFSGFIGDTSLFPASGLPLRGIYSGAMTDFTVKLRFEAVVKKIAPRIDPTNTAGVKYYTHLYPVTATPVSAPYNASAFTSDYSPNYAAAMFLEPLSQYRINTSNIYTGEGEGNFNVTTWKIDEMDTWDNDDATQSRVAGNVTTQGVRNDQNRGNVSKRVYTDNTTAHAPAAITSQYMTTTGDLIRTYQLIVYNYGMNKMTLNKVVDILPEYEEFYVNLNTNHKPGAILCTANSLNYVTANGWVIPEPTAVKLKDGRQQLTFSSFAKDGAAATPLEIPTPSYGTGGTNYQAAIIAYDVIIHKEDMAAAMMAEGLTDENRTDKNVAAFYFAGRSAESGDVGRLELYPTTTGYGVFKDDTAPDANHPGAGGWDGDTETPIRYEATLNVSVSLPKVVPTVYIDAQFINTAPGHQGYEGYDQQKLKPQDIVGWRVRAANEAAATTPMANPRLVVEFPADSLKLAGLGDLTIDPAKIKMGGNNAAGLLGTPSFKIADGKGILEWQLSGTLYPGQMLEFYIDTQIAKDYYGDIEANVYLKPNEVFYTYDLARFTECRDVFGFDWSRFSGGASQDHIVMDNDAVTCMGDIAAYSSKTVTEIGKESNTTNSAAAMPRVITLTSYQSPFRYKLELTNRGEKQYQNTTVIDRLPARVNDRTSTDAAARYSEATAIPADELNLSAAIQSGANTTNLVEGADYTLSFTDAATTVKFTDADWNGQNGAAAWSDDPAGATALRVQLVGGRVIAPGEKLVITFDARLDPATYESGKIAYNSFGYRIEANVGTTNSPVIMKPKAEPYKVGVRAYAEKIVINKAIVDNRELAVPVTFLFDVYIAGQAEPIARDVEVRVNTNGTSTMLNGPVWNFVPINPSTQRYELVEKNGGADYTNNLAALTAVRTQDALNGNVYTYTFNVINYPVRTITGEINKIVLGPDGSPAAAAGTYQFLLKDKNGAYVKEPGTEDNAVFTVTPGTPTPIDSKYFSDYDGEYSIEEVGESGGYLGNFKVSYEAAPAPDTNAKHWTFTCTNAETKREAQIVKVLGNLGAIGAERLPLTFRFSLFENGAPVAAATVTYAGEAPSSGEKWQSAPVKFDYQLRTDAVYTVAETGADENYFTVTQPGEPTQNTDKANNVVTFTFTGENTAKEAKHYARVTKSVALNGNESRSRDVFNFTLKKNAATVGYAIVNLAAEGGGSSYFYTDLAGGALVEINPDEIAQYTVVETDPGDYETVISPVPGSSANADNSIDWVFTCVNTEFASSGDLVKTVTLNGQPKPADDLDLVLGFVVQELTEDGYTTVSEPFGMMYPYQGKWNGDTWTSNKVNVPYAFEKGKTYRVAEQGVGGVIVEDGETSGFWAVSYTANSSAPEGNQNAAHWSFTATNAGLAPKYYASVTKAVTGGVPDEGRTFRFGLFEGTGLVDSVELAFAAGETVKTARFERALDKLKTYSVFELDKDSKAIANGGYTDGFGYCVTYPAAGGEAVYDPEANEYVCSFTALNTRVTTTGSMIKKVSLDPARLTDAAYMAALPKTYTANIYEADEDGNPTDVFAAGPFVFQLDVNAISPTGEWVSAPQEVAGLNPAKSYAAVEQGVDASYFTVTYNADSDLEGTEKAWSFVVQNTATAGTTKAKIKKTVIENGVTNYTATFTFNLLEDGEIFDTVTMNWPGEKEKTFAKNLDPAKTYTVEEANADPTTAVTYHTEAAEFASNVRTLVFTANNTLRNPKADGSIVKTVTWAAGDEKNLVRRTFQFQIVEQGGATPVSFGGKDTFDIVFDPAASGFDSHVNGNTWISDELVLPAGVLDAAKTYALKELGGADFAANFTCKTAAVSAADTTNKLVWRFTADNQKTPRSYLARVEKTIVGYDGKDVTDSSADSFWFGLFEQGGGEPVAKAELNSGNGFASTFGGYALDGSLAYTVRELEGENGDPIPADSFNGKWKVTYGTPNASFDTATNTETVLFRATNTETPAHVTITKRVTSASRQIPTIDTFRFKLEQADSANGPWAEIPGKSPVEITVSYAEGESWSNSVTVGGLDPDKFYRFEELGVDENGQLAGANGVEFDVSYSGPVNPVHQFVDGVAAWEFGCLNEKIPETETVRVRKVIDLGGNAEPFETRTFTFNLYDYTLSKTEIYSTVDVTVTKNGDGVWGGTAEFPRKFQKFHEIHVFEAGEEDGQSGDYAVTYSELLPVTNEEGLYEITVTNAMPKIAGTITKTLNFAGDAPKDTQFQVGLFEEGNDTAIRVYTIDVAAQEGGVAAGAVEIEDGVLQLGKEYTVAEIGVDADRYAPPIESWDSDTDADGNTTWRFGVVNNEKSATITLTKYLTVRGQSPRGGLDTFTFNVYEKKNGLRDLYQIVNIKVNRPAEGNVWAGTAVLDVDFNASYEFEEVGESIFRDAGYTVRIISQMEIVNDGTRKNWHFTANNVEPEARTAHAVITKHLFTNAANPRKNFSFELLETKDGRTTVFGTYELTVVQLENDYYTNSTLLIPGLDPDAAYAVREVGRDALLAQGYSIREMGTVSERGPITSWQFDVYNRRYAESTTDSRDGGSTARDGDNTTNLRFVETVPNDLVSINDLNVPLTNIPDSSIPLAALPTTGRSVAAILGSAGLLLLGIVLKVGRKREDE